MRWLAIWLFVACAIAPVARADKPAAKSTDKPAATGDAREATRRAAHDALVEHCGSCHEGHRSKNAKALAVYDLDKPDWYTQFDDRKSQGAARRLASRSPAARDAFLAFRDAEKAAATQTR
jgi:predicted CXXCH cytochrome family protein